MRHLFLHFASVVAVHGSLCLALSCKQSIEYGSSGVPAPVASQPAGQNPQAAAPDTFGTFSPANPVTTQPAPSSNETATECCFFPLAAFPSLAFNDGSVRSFGALRDGGSRKHAACDLYSAVGKEVYAVEAGKILDYYYFYSGTYAVEVRHKNFIVRYGEVLGLAKGVAVGSSVKAGQVIAKVGRLICCPPMLHFEKFTGSAAGPLSNGTAPFRRRSDLVNPTADLLDWKSKLPK